MRWIPLVVLALAVLPEAGAAPVPKHLMKDEPFWPTAVGTRWVYEQNGKEAVEEITKAEKHNDCVRLTISQKHNGTNVLAVSRAGVTRMNRGVGSADVLLLRFPAKPGDSWPVAISIQDGVTNLGGRMTVGEDEDVTVPAGTFRATKVTFALTIIDGVPTESRSETVYWYAKGVGIVRIKGYKMERVLKSFTPGKN